MHLILELLGTAAFAVSGAMTGIRNHMDILGVAVLGMTTAVGGGILRDVIVGMTPPTAFTTPVYALAALIISLIVFIPGIRGRVNTDSFALTLVDAVGLGVFTVVGVRSGMAWDNLFLQIFLGTVTGVGGGVLRDIFAMQKPVIFVKHFYAVASIAGAAVCALLYPLSPEPAMIAGACVIIVLRVLAARYRWNLPKA